MSKIKMNVRVRESFAGPEHFQIFRDVYSVDFLDPNVRPTWLAFEEIEGVGTTLVITVRVKEGSNRKLDASMPGVSGLFIATKEVTCQEE